MPLKRRSTPRGKRDAKAGSRWKRAVQEAGEAAARAALPILIRFLTEALPGKAGRTAGDEGGHDRGPQQPAIPPAKPATRARRRKTARAAK